MDLVRRIRDRLKKLAVRIADAVGLAKHVEQTPVAIPVRVEQTIDAVCSTPEKGMAQETGQACGMTDVQRGSVPDVHERVDDSDVAADGPRSTLECPGSRVHGFKSTLECPVSPAYGFKSTLECPIGRAHGPKSTL